MAQIQGIPRGAAVAIDDMLDHCAANLAVLERNGQWTGFSAITRQLPA